MYWYEDEVKRLENLGLTHGYEAESLFFGSSSVRLWESLGQDFAAFNPVNLGFGGSTLAACVWFFERIMTPYHPKRLFLYAGDNDLGDGRHPEEVFIFFQQFLVKANKQFGDLPCYFISLKPSPSRQHLLDYFKYTNQLIENEIKQHQPSWQYINVFNEMIDSAGHAVSSYFQPDGLHLNEDGYRLWTATILKQLIH